LFHKCANGKKRKTAIKSLEEGGRVITDPKELRQHIDSYYKKLFGREQTEDIHLMEDVWQEHQKVSIEENEELIKPFTWEELDLAMKETKNNTAPGLDGLSVEFLKKFWPLIRPLIKEMLDDLHQGSFDLRRLNYRVIILLPKLKLPNNIKQFRPICLLNVIYKIITKVLTLRLSKIAGRIISGNQTAFIPGRNILDGVVILQEVLHELRVKNQRGVVLKLDFEKAYDRVEWSFLEEVLRKKVLSTTWIGWVMKTVQSGKVTIDINGERGEFFQSYRGLRQGDPLSPLLFNLVGDALSAMLHLAGARGEIKGLVPHLIEGGLTHLQYADDTVYLWSTMR